MRLGCSFCLVSIATATMVAAGCVPQLDPLVSDEPGVSTHILPPGSEVPHVSEDADLTRQIRINDGLNDMTLAMSGGLLALKKGWAAGTTISYWDFGDAPQVGALLYVLVEKDGDTVTPIDHPYVAAVIPGDPGYSPFWMVQHVVVTERYHGEILPSALAIADAVELGLVEEPVPAQLFMDGPIVAAGTTLDMGAGQPPQPTIQVLARDHLVDMFAIGGANAMQVMAKPGKIPRGDVHMLFEGNAVAALKTPLFQNLGSPWTPAVRPINCRVLAADPLDPTTLLNDEAKLFTRDMMGNMVTASSRVVSWTLTTSTKNWPILVAAPVMP